LFHGLQAPTASDQEETKADPSRKEFKELERTRPPLNELMDVPEMGTKRTVAAVTDGSDSFVEIGFES
jgi:hypothetical protein